MNSKHRLIMLIASGILLLGATCYVVWHHSSKKEDPSAELTTEAQSSGNRIPVSTKKVASLPITRTTTTSVDSKDAQTNNPEEANKKEDTSPQIAEKAVSIDGKLKVPAITRHDASKEAHENAGRQDPMMHVSGYLPFPAPPPSQTIANKNSKNIWEKPPSKIPKLVPPPPSDMARLVPPPPPSSEFPRQDSIGNLPISTLPNPPSRPTLVDKLRLISVMDDRAILCFSNTALQSKNKWPKTLTLSPGDQFESVSVISVDRDSVTLQEDGERSVKTLDRIR